MAVLDFPANPTVGQEYDFPPYTYVWDGEKWNTVVETSTDNLREDLAADTGATLVGTGSGQTVQVGLDGKVNKAGDTMTGDLSIASASNTGMLKFGSNNQQYLQASSDNNMYLFANNGKIVFKGLNLPVVRVGSTDHLIYHAGNKPTNKDVNAGRVTQEIPFGNNSNAITTAQFITLLDSHGAFDQFYWYARGTWSYASNQVITDTGCGNVHLAGCVVEVFHKYGNGATDAGYTIRVTGPTTTGGTGLACGDWVYVNNGETYAPGWRRMYNTKLPPTALEVGAASIDKVNELENMIAELRAEVNELKTLLKK